MPKYAEEHYDEAYKLPPVALAVWSWKDAVADRMAQLVMYGKAAYWASQIPRRIGGADRKALGMDKRAMRKVVYTIDGILHRWRIYVDFGGGSLTENVPEDARKIGAQMDLPSFFIQAKMTAEKDRSVIVTRMFQQEQPMRTINQVCGAFDWEIYEYNRLADWYLVQ